MQLSPCAVIVAQESVVKASRWWCIVSLLLSLRLCWTPTVGGCLMLLPVVLMLLLHRPCSYRVMYTVCSFQSRDVCFVCLYGAELSLYFTSVVMLVHYNSDSFHTRQLQFLSFFPPSNTIIHSPFQPFLVIHLLTLTLHLRPLLVSSPPSESSFLSHTQVFFPCPRLSATPSLQVSVPEPLHWLVVCTARVSVW